MEETRDKGFEPNPYNICVASEIVGGKKMKIFWHVDDLNVSHVDPKEVTKFMEWIEGIYSELSITRGKLHKYFGMTIDFPTPGEIRVTMVDYLKGVVEDLLEAIRGWRTRLTVSHIFQARPEYKRKILE